MRENEKLQKILKNYLYHNKSNNFNEYNEIINYKNNQINSNGNNDIPYAEYENRLISQEGNKFINN